jgi:hypothetical protein
MNALMDAYPEVSGMLGEQDQVLCDEMYGHSLEYWATQLENGLAPYHLGERAFRAYVDVPNDPSGNVVIVGGEHGNSYWAQHNKKVANPSIVRAHVIRDMVDEHATLVYPAGDALGENNLGLTPDELQRIAHGDSSPISDRWNTIIEQLPNSKTLRAGVGLSLSATILSGAMARSGLGPVDSVVCVETPNVVSRTEPALGIDFVKGGGSLGDNIRLNASLDVKSEVIKEHTKSINMARVRGLWGTAKYAKGLWLPSNRALLAPMCNDTLESSIIQSLGQGTAVVHAWGTMANVSPASANRRIRDAIGPHDRYRPFEFGGPLADHSLTNVALLVGALARHASNIKS